MILRILVIYMVGVRNHSLKKENEYKNKKRSAFCEFTDNLFTWYCIECWFFMDLVNNAIVMCRCFATSWCGTGRWFVWSWWRGDGAEGVEEVPRPLSSSAPFATMLSLAFTTPGLVSSSLLAVKLCTSDFGGNELNNVLIIEIKISLFCR